ncbi:MAG: hypothetical protein ACKPKO_09375, partial [Candidatus Fonsibacter sp.]
LVICIDVTDIDVRGQIANHLSISTISNVPPVGPIIPTSHLSFPTSRPTHIAWSGCRSPQSQLAHRLHGT